MKEMLKILGFAGMFVSSAAGYFVVKFWLTAP
jgi:hypothetical protein